MSHRRRAIQVAREPLPTRVDGLPDLPEAYTHALDAGLGPAGIRLTPAARAAIDGHVRLLLAWNEAINLTAIRDPAEVALRHVVDSLTALPVLRAAGVDRFVDLGSGGGFPGIPLAAALPGRALLVDSVGKKATFLSTVVAAIGLDERVAVANARAETLAADPDQRGHWPAVVARAVGSLADLVELGLPLLEPGGQLVAWKRGDLVDEVAAARRAIEGLGGGTLTSVEPGVPGMDGHRLVVVRPRRAAPAAYPRDPAERRRRPW